MDSHAYETALTEAGFTEVALTDTSSDCRALCDRQYTPMRGKLKAEITVAPGNGGHQHFL